MAKQLLFFAIFCIAALVDSTKVDRSFQIDYSNNQFLKDGKPFRYVSGSIHYFRVHPDDWYDRLYKLRYAGFNAVQTYIEWSSHEPEPGVFDFSGGLNITHFLDIAQSLNLSVILRPGPYICAERDMGGLPYWLLKVDPKINLRSSDPTFLMYAASWFEKLLPMMKPYLYGNGGPIIMVQVENEYGSFGACDYVYTGFLRDLVNKHVQNKAVLFTTDGSGVGFLKCGKIPEVYATVDFGTGGGFSPQRIFEPHGPLVNSEFYSGWLDHWSEPHQTVATESVTKSLDSMLSQNASVNMYMFIGGTNFGLKAGANEGGDYQPQPTSYDYDAPLTEAGDPTPKYYAIRDVVGKYLPLPNINPPKASEKNSYGKVSLEAYGHYIHLDEVNQEISNEYPMTFEALSVDTGFVQYSADLNFQMTSPAQLTINGLHDRGYVFINDEMVGIVSREKDLKSLNIFTTPNSTLKILVESLGRINYGNNINDFKGITGDVTINSKTVTNWKMIRLPIGVKGDAFLSMTTRMSARRNKSVIDTLHMGLFVGRFNITAPNPGVKDTFLNMINWTKGIAWINDLCLGRYWPSVGPQVTLYVPRGVLKTGENVIYLMELENSPCVTTNGCNVMFQDYPVLNGTTPTV